MFSVDTEAEAEFLIALTCPRDARGTYYSRELQREQTLDNLQAFGDKLARAYVAMKSKKR